MEAPDVDDRIHVMDAKMDVATVVRNICQSGGQREAFRVLDIGDVVSKHRHWRVKMPRVEPYYAVRCNDNLRVLEILAALGTGFACACKAEVDQVLDLGVDPNRVMFANPTKLPSHIRHAAKRGVKLMTFDSEMELHKVKSLHPKARLLLRIQCDHQGALKPTDHKFGCDAASEGPRLLEVALALRLEVVGVCFNVGSGSCEPTVFQRTVATTRAVFDHGIKLGFRMDVLNLGGDYPGKKGTSIDEIACDVNAALAEHFPSPMVQVIAEPGSYFVASAFTLATFIHSKREVRSNSSDEIVHINYYVDVGVHGCFNGGLHDGGHTVPKPLYQHSVGNVPSSVWGPTCNDWDRINADVMLPMMHVGDWISYEDVGACGVSLDGGFPIPRVLSIMDKALW